MMIHLFQRMACLMRIIIVEYAEVVRYGGQYGKAAPPGHALAMCFFYE